MAEGTPNATNEYVGGVERLQTAYSLERYVCLGGLVLGMVLFAFLTLMTAFGYVEKEDWVPLFAPDGVFMGLCMGGMVYYGKSQEYLRTLAERNRGQH